MKIQLNHEKLLYLNIKKILSKNLIYWFKKVSKVTHDDVNVLFIGL